MSGRPSATVVPEAYVDAGVLAVLMGVSTSTIKRMVAAGMPSETWGMRRTRRFLPSEAIGWAQQRDKMLSNPGVRDRNAPGPRQPKE